MNFVRKQPNEEFPVSIDFGGELALGEFISSAAVTVRNAATGADSGAAIKEGPESIAGPVVTQGIRGGANGERHILTMLATTSLGNKWEDEISITITEV